MSKHHGFLFTAPMVRAIMADPMRKTCTRRVVSPYNSLIDGTGKGIRACWPEMHWKEARVIRSGQAFKVSCFQCGRPHIVTPRVQPGHWIYAKETHRFYGPPNGPESVEYAAEYDDEIAYGAVSWRSSIHMPKRASRAWLPVTRVGAGRVQSITRADVFLEGCPPEVGGRDGDIAAAGAWFRKLWDQINGQKPGCSWAANPPCWDFHWEERREKP